MIGEPFALQIKENIDRPSIKLINKFKNVPTTHLADALNGLGCLDYKIKPIDEKMSFLGDLAGERESRYVLNAGTKIFIDTND